MPKSIRFKVEKDRILLPVGEPCSFACKYCYTRSGEIGPSRISIKEILQHLHSFASQNEFGTIQLGYDGDPFARPERGIALLKGIAEMDKHINFSTKASLDEQTIKEISQIQNQLESADKILSALVSLSCWQSAHIIEPNTPTPEMRMQTVQNLRAIGVITFIAIRPILPNVNDEEYEKIFDEGLVAGCDGFILGPLYADDKGVFVRFIPPEVLRKLASIREVVPWSAHSPIWTRYEDQDRLERLVSMINVKGGRVFMSSVDAIASINKYA